MMTESDSTSIQFSEQVDDEMLSDTSTVQQRHPGKNNGQGERLFGNMADKTSSTKKLVEYVQDRKDLLRNAFSVVLLLLIFLTLLLVGLLTTSDETPSNGVATTRYYYIQAEEIDWDYAPSKKDLLNGGNLAKETPWNSTVWRKAVYTQYTNESFTTRIEKDSHLGILGPVIRAEVMDTIIIKFRNTLDFPVSIHPHGVLYAKDSEGMYYIDSDSEMKKAKINTKKSRGVAQPGDTITLQWEVPERAGPIGDLSSTVWMYHSSVDEGREINAGLLGPIVITKNGFGDESGAPIDVSAEWITFYTIFDEAASKLKSENMDKMGTKQKNKNMDETTITMDLTNPILFHTLNGYVYNNMPTFTGQFGKTVRWHMLGLGGEMDIHTVHTHGHTMSDGIYQTDTVMLLPGVSKTMNMLLDNSGTWLYHCHVINHADRMSGLYTVNS